MQSKTKYFPLSSIPNIDGFKFIGLTYENIEIECTVIKDNETGVHTISNGQFHSLKSWRIK
jgi:hypothetical protein